MKYLIIGLLSALCASAEAKFAEKTNGEAITISGKVTNVKADTFNLKTADKNILVEMDDYSNWVADGFKLRDGDEVIVYGRVDQDLFEKKKIEAGTVYVKNINTTFYANSADEEDRAYTPTNYDLYTGLKEGAFVDLKGKITKVSGREFTMDTGLRRVTVDTQSLLFNPLDKKGYTRLEPGDQVRVTGTVENEYFDSKEVSAATVIELPATKL